MSGPTCIKASTETWKKKTHKIPLASREDRQGSLQLARARMWLWRGLWKIKGGDPQGQGCSWDWRMPLNLRQRWPQRGLRPLTPAWPWLGRYWHSFTMWFPQCWGYSLGMSIISDQTREGRGHICRKWEEIRQVGEQEGRPHHGARVAGSRVRGPLVQRHWVKPWVLEPRDQLLLLRKEVSG